jgi:anti-anti-sigma factor
MQFDAQRQDQIISITVCGDLTIFEAEQFHQALCELLIQDFAISTVRLDLSEVKEFDTSGLQILLSLKHTYISQHKIFVISRASDSVREFVELMAQTTLLNETANGF